MERDINYLPVLFHSLHKQMMDEHDKILSEFDVTKKHVPFIMVLSRFDDGLTQQELSEKLNLDKAHTSRTLRDLEDKGYVEKLGETSYKNKFVITEKAQQIKALIKERNHAIVKKVLEVLTEEELDQFEYIIRKLTSAL